MVVLGGSSTVTAATPQSHRASGGKVERLGLLTAGLITALMFVLLVSRISFAEERVITAAPGAYESHLEQTLGRASGGGRRKPPLPPPPSAAEPTKKRPAREEVDPADGANTDNGAGGGDAPAADNAARGLSDGFKLSRGMAEVPEASVESHSAFVVLPSSGTTRKLVVAKAVAATHHVAAAAEGAKFIGPLKLAHPWKNPNLDDVTGPNIRTLPANGSFVCEFFLFGMPHVCRIEQGQESMAECIQRVGGRVLEDALPTRCTKTEYWQTVRNLGPDKSPAGAEAGGAASPTTATGQQFKNVVGRDWVYMAQTAPNMDPVPYIPPDQRTFRRDIESKQCSYGTLHPITFGVPYRNIVPAVTRHKFFDFLPYGMRKFPPWIYKPGDYRMGHQDEFLTSLLHKHSYFAFTHKRGGWDCMRHTEIFAAGSIPYFADIHMCGKYCLALLPKDLLKEALEMPGVSYIGSMHGKTSPNQEFIEPVARATANMNFKKPGRIEWKTFDEERYWDLADRMLDYAQKYLSTRSIVSYVLHKIGYEEPKHAFVLGRDHMDYLELMMESGFADLGINYTTHHARPTWHQVVEEEDGRHYTAAEFEAIRTKRGLKSEMHGASMVVGLRTPPLQNSVDHDTIRAKLAAGEFDLVVYTWPHWPPTGYPFWAEVSKALPRERIVFIDGGDDGADPHNDFRGAIKHGHIFRRELHDGGC